MTKTTGTNLFKDAAKWPMLPPWWLVSAPQAAALLNVTPATLSNWRIRGEGPTPVPPMYLRPTQGNPIYYRYANVRAWAATKVGLEYDYADQCEDFVRAVIPKLAEVATNPQAQAANFDLLYKVDHKKVLEGQDPTYFRLEDIEALDVFYAKQPQNLGKKKKPRLSRNIRTTSV